MQHAHLQTREGASRQPSGPNEIQSRPIAQRELLRARTFPRKTQRFVEVKSPGETHRKFETDAQGQTDPLCVSPALWTEPREGIEELELSSRYLVPPQGASGVRGRDRPPPSGVVSRVQSGRGKQKTWILEFETKDPHTNSLMGWEMRK